MNNTVLNITCKNGKSHCNIDLSMFLDVYLSECNNKQLKLLFEMVQEDYNNIQDHVKTIQEFITNKVNYYTENDWMKKTYASTVKKLVSIANYTCKYFNLPEMVFDNYDKSEKIKFKKTFVYTLLSNGQGGQKIACYPGYRFEKYGMIFHVYGKKAGRKTYYNVIVPSIGLAIGNDNCTNKQAAADLITQDLIDVIKNQCKKNYINWYNTFIETAKNSDYPQILDIDDYKPIAEYYNKPETATNTAITVNETVNNIVTENKPETAINETVNHDYDNVNIETLSDKFRQVYNYLYDHNNCYPGYDYYTCMHEFDNNFNKYKTIATMLSEKRHDYITSDRETVAFIIALDIISKKPAKKIFKPSKWNLSKRHNTVSSIINNMAFKAIYTTITRNTANNTSKAAHKADKPMTVYNPITYVGNGYNISNKPYNSIKASAIEYIGIWNNIIPYYDSS